MPGASTPSSYSSTNPTKASDAVLVLGVADGKVRGLDSAKAATTALNDAAKAIEFTGKAGATVRIPSPKGVAAGGILLVGLGSFDPAKSDDDTADRETLRRAAGSAPRALSGASSIALARRSPPPRMSRP
ncbi:hypothetical protein IOD13_06920 [Brevibacterium casei]|nr:hypothetical protein [Brevibacterium casei]